MRTIFQKKEHNDSGLALILILLILFLFFHLKIFVLAAIFVALVTMVYSPLILPFTFFWLNFSHILGTFMSKVILTIIFLIFVVPVAFIRRLAGKDTLLLKRFKKENTSVFVVREHLYTKTDIEKPY